MLKKEIKFVDFDGNECVETHHFHLTAADIAEMEVTAEGGSYGDILKKIIETQQVGELVKVFKHLILASYGEKDADGKHFYKSPELSKKFAASAAYSALFIELATDDSAASAFCVGIMPSDLAEKIEQLQPKLPLQTDTKPLPPPAPSVV